MTDNKNKNIEAHPLVKENDLLSTRVRLAHAFTQLWVTAYDALLHHKVNMRELPEYKDDALIDRALKGDLRHGEVHILEYIKRVSNGIAAAIRRKSLRQV